MEFGHGGDEADQGDQVVLAGLVVAGAVLEERDERGLAVFGHGHGEHDLAEVVGDWGGAGALGGHALEKGGGVELFAAAAVVARLGAHAGDQPRGGVLAEEEGRGVDPVPAALPAGDAGRVEQVHAQLAHGEVHRAVVAVGGPEHAGRADDELGGVFDLRAHDRRVVEVLAGQQALERALEAVVVGPQAVGQADDHAAVLVRHVAQVVRHVGDKPAVELERRKPGAGLALEQQIGEVVAVERALDPEDRLVVGVVLALVEVEVVVVAGEPGQGAGAFADVGFGVFALAEGEELHELAGEVLVGPAAAVAVVVEEHQHGRVAHDAPHHVGERAVGVAAEQCVLLEHEVRITHVAPARGEVAVPQQHQLLLHRARRARHPAGPPVAQLIDQPTVSPVARLPARGGLLAGCCAG